MIIISCTYCRRIPSNWIPFTLPNTWFTNCSNTHRRSSYNKDRETVEKNNKQTEKMLVVNMEVKDSLWSNFWSTELCRVPPQTHVKTKQITTVKVLISVVFRRLRDKRGRKRFSHTRLVAWTRVHGGSQVMWEVQGSLHVCHPTLPDTLPPTHPCMEYF